MVLFSLLIHHINEQRVEGWVGEEEFRVLGGDMILFVIPLISGFHCRWGLPDDSSGFL